MTKPNEACPLCQLPAAEQNRLNEGIRNGWGRLRISDQLRLDGHSGFTQHSIREHLRKHSVRAVQTTPDPVAHTSSPVSTLPVPGVPRGWEAGIEMGQEAGSITTGSVEAPITDWNSLLAVWGLDPVMFEVVEPASFKAWDGFAKETDADGTQRVMSKRLYSYKAQIRRRSQTEVQLDGLAARWEARLAASRTTFKLKKVAGIEVAYLIAVADPQLGKKGTQTALENWRRGIEGHVQRIARLRMVGYNISKVVLAFQGDEHEGVANNYSAQAFLSELNFSEQLELDFDMRVWSIERVAELGLQVEVTSVISNHGEWTRNGGKDVVTTKSDNSSTSIARMVKKLFDKLPQFSHVSWNIADSNPEIVTNIFGVKTLLTHGHVAKGRGQSTEQRAKNAIEKQILGRTIELADLKLVIGAHYHHFYMLESEGRTFFGCPALEADKSSEYMLEQYGVWSPSGMLGLMIGHGLGIRGWAEPAVI